MFRWTVLGDDNELWNRLIPSLGGGVARRTLNYLRARARAVAVLEEDFYIDRDHRSAHSYFYTKQFRGTNALCRRFHFFRTSGEWDAGEWDVRQASTPPADAYLGYIVQRPIPSAPIGRSVLAVNAGTLPIASLYCRGTYRSNVNDSELVVVGVPFAQQDAMVMTCAETSMWVAARVMTENFRHPLILPEHITHPDVISNRENGRILPSDGLNPNQITHALSRLGFDPVQYAFDHIPGTGQPSERLDVIETCVPYLISKIPIIITLPGHAVVACGVVRSGNSVPDSKSHCVSTHEWVDGIVVQDDSQGPYRILPADAETQEYLVDRGYRDVTMSQHRNPRLMTGERRWHTELAENAIVPLPPKVYLTAKDAHAIAKGLLAPQSCPLLSPLKVAATTLMNHDAQTILRALQQGNHGGVVYSVRCRSSIDVRRDFQKASPRVQSILKDTSLPRQVWAIECTTREAFCEQKQEDRLLYGEFYLDATGDKYAGPTLIVFARLVGVVLVRPRLSAGSDEARSFVIEDDFAYYRSAIPLWSDHLDFGGNSGA